jgi:hypothetical protein
MDVSEKRRKSMRFAVITAVFLLILPSISSGQNIIWSRTYGGELADRAYWEIPTHDNGFLIVGSTQSFAIAGETDVWMVKTDSLGDTLWTRVYGGDGDRERAYRVKQTNDNGFIIVGQSDSRHGSEVDYLVIKTDSLGEAEWAKLYGGDGYDQGRDIIQTSDGGYAVIGMSASFYNQADPNVLISHDMDIYVVRIDCNGDTLWTRVYDRYYQGPEQVGDYGSSIIETPDGGFIMIGCTEPYPDSVNRNDLLIIRTDSSGDTLWTKVYGSAYQDECKIIRRTSDGNYFIAGRTGSGYSRFLDYWLLKIDENGDTLWTNTYGWAAHDYCYGAQETPDKGFILSGRSQITKYGDLDIGVVKTDSLGQMQWSARLGGVEDEYSYSIHNVPSGGYIVSGFTRSYGAGMFDFWLVRLGNEIASVEITPDQPNPVVPPGGSFTYRGVLMNNTFDRRTTDIWIKVKRSDNSYYPINRYDNINISRYDTLAFHPVVQYVPEYAPEGEYLYIVYCGESDEIYDSSYFEFEVRNGFTPDRNMFRFLDSGEPQNDTWRIAAGFDSPDTGRGEIPESYMTAHNYPNPFNQQTRIEFYIAKSSRIKLEVYNLLGRRIEVLTDAVYPAGRHSVSWEAADNASGIYFYKLSSSAGHGLVKRMLLLK